MASENQLEIEVLWFDEDLVELRVSAANRDFSGTAVLYEAHDFAERLEKSIVGFPRNASDERSFELGDCDGRSGARLELRCLDHSGHACLVVSLSNDGSDYSGLPAKVQLSMPVEAGGIDRFSSALNAMRVEFDSKVVLIPAA